VQLVKQESKDQAEKLDNIHSGKGCEVPCENVWMPDIPFTYDEFKEKADIDKMTEMNNKQTKERII
jgi:hypothetical protein